MVKNESLQRRLRALGFPLFEAEADQDANLTLADLVKSRDLRLWEGFPTVLANSAAKGLFDHDKVLRHLKKPSDRSCFYSLTVMSLALYRASGVRFSWADALHDSLDTDRKKKYERFFSSFKKNSGFKVGSHEMSAQRVKENFNNYLNRAGSRLEEFLSAKEELGLEYALSQVFSPKQKDLFLKKLKGEKLTKTEKEYFSRVVKKRVLALANTELHRLARKLLE